MSSNEDYTHEDINARVENSSQRAAEGQIKVDMIQAEPKATVNIHINAANNNKIKKEVSQHKILLL